MMKPDVIHYDRNDLEELLGDRLNRAQREEIESHLYHCESCRHQLQEIAAEESLWNEAGDLLASDELDSLEDGVLTGIRPVDASAVTQQVGSNNQITDCDGPAGARQILAWLQPTDDPAMLGRLGGYEIAGVIGSGGMGVVLKGFDRSLNRYVAIKVLAPHMATSGAARQRFAREAQAAAAVVHNNVVAIHGVDESDGLPYLVMPYLRGISLQKRIDQSGSLNVSEVLRIGLQTARGLAAAHDQGLVHRDVKPANILLDGTTERVLLTDFGLARVADDASLTHSGVIAGTPHYMSPEQAEGAAVDHRSDLFSLGSVMYAMCTGRPPFRSDTTWGTVRRVTDSEPHSIRDLNPEIPVWLCSVINTLHQKTPQCRYQSAHQVADLLEDCLAHIQQPDQVELPKEIQPLVEQTSRNPVSNIVWAVTCIAMLIVAGMFLWPDWRDKGTSEHSSTGGLQSVEEHAGTETLESEQSETGQDVANTDSVDAIINDELAEWDNLTTELADIRAAVQSLDERSMQIIFEDQQQDVDQDNP